MEIVLVFPLLIAIIMALAYSLLARRNDHAAKAATRDNARSGDWGKFSRYRTPRAWSTYGRLGL